MAQVECDYCGDLFDENLEDPQCAEQDECVCPECSDTAHEQYRLMGMVDDEDDDEISW